MCSHLHSSILILFQYSGEASLKKKLVIQKNNTSEPAALLLLALLGKQPTLLCSPVRIRQNLVLDRTTVRPITWQGLLGNS